MGRRRWGFAIGVSACLLAWPALSATNAGSNPDFSGIWGRTSVDFEPPPSGAGPVMNKTRTFYMRIGDDANPILKPQAAEKVREAGAISRTGVNFSTPSNSCTPWSPLMRGGRFRCRFCSRRIRSSFSMSAISKSAMCD